MLQHITNHKFVIFSQPRTGSSLLVQTLYNHPEILMYGEILNNYSGWDGAKVIENIYRHNLGRQAIGFKLHASQPWPVGEWRPLETAWDAIAANTSIKLIFLYRRDLLAQLVSWKIAHLLGSFGAQPSTERPLVAITHDELYWFSQLIYSVISLRLLRLQTRPQCKIAYEDLIDNWDASLGQILNFIGVEPLALPMGQARSEPRPLSQIVTNWDQIKDSTRRWFDSSLIIG